MKAVASEWGATSLLLRAMSLKQQRRNPEAKEALKKAAEWWEERQRRAEDDPGLRIQLEMMRPGVDALRREAEGLIEGKDRGEEKVGQAGKGGDPPRARTRFAVIWGTASRAGPTAVTSRLRTRTGAACRPG
jgi:hypothetical protein